MIVYEDFPLNDILYYKIGGNARFVLKVQNEEDLLAALEFVKKNKIQRKLLVGLGCKLLVSDNFFDGVVIWFAKSDKSSIRETQDGLIEAFAGEALDNLIQFCFKNNLRGLEWAGGLPSTVGGAVRGNSGAFGGEIGNSIEKVEAFDLTTNEWKMLSNKELKFSYRDSFIKRNKNLIVSTVIFKLSKVDDMGIDQAKKIYLANITYRKNHHPLDYPSCGSVFKTIIAKKETEAVTSKWPEVKRHSEDKWDGKLPMGYIIQKLGFSGFAVGGAKVSEKQANFIVNFNNAKFDDVYSIINKIKDKFFETFGFYPELEVEVIK